MLGCSLLVLTLVHCFAMNGLSKRYKNHSTIVLGTPHLVSHATSYTILEGIGQGLLKVIAKTHSGEKELTILNPCLAAADVLIVPATRDQQVTTLLRPRNYGMKNCLASMPSSPTHTASV